MGNLQEDAGAIACVFLATTRATMLKIEQQLDGSLDDIVRLATLDINDEPRTTSVVLGAPQPAWGGSSLRYH